MENLTEWVGFRPSTQDSLPIIGQSGTNPYVYWNTGGGNIGFILSSGMAKTLSEDLLGKSPVPDAFSPLRFGL
jgi:D-amino-acid dehydrogenase